MTHDQMIEVIQAHKEGKQLQLKQKGQEGWMELHKGCFSGQFGTYDYRIKPEPKVPRAIFIIQATNGELCTDCGPFEVQHEAELAFQGVHSHKEGGKVLTFREVLEEQI